MIQLFAALIPTLFAVTFVHSHLLNSTPDASQLLLQSNARWAENTTRSNPTFFTNSAGGQTPKILWIGCSDSRVPESVITGSLPGDIFVQRNIANQVPCEDANALSVLEYAVEHLLVEHVIVVGHSRCGGVNASFQVAQSNSDPSRTIDDLPPSDPLNKWLEPLTELAFSLKPKWSSMSPSQALQYIVEENVKKQVESIVEKKVIEDVWKHELEGKGRKVRIHGWVYELSTGLLKDLNVTRGPLGH